MTEARKTVTVVFADVTGWTGLGEHLDPEALRRVIARYFEEMGAVLGTPHPARSDFSEHARQRMRCGSGSRHLPIVGAEFARGKSARQMLLDARRGPRTPSKTPSPRRACRGWLITAPAAGNRSRVSGIAALRPRHQYLRTARKVVPWKRRSLRHLGAVRRPGRAAARAELDSSARGLELDRDHRDPLLVELRALS